MSKIQGISAELTQVRERLLRAKARLRRTGWDIAVSSLLLVICFVGAAINFRLVEGASWGSVIAALAGITSIVHVIAGRVEGSTNRGEET